MSLGHSIQEPLYDPVFKYYEPHNGELVSIQFSPNNAEMFLSSGNDAEIRIYIIGQVGNFKSFLKVKTHLNNLFI